MNTPQEIVKEKESISCSAQGIKARHNKQEAKQIEQLTERNDISPGEPFRLSDNLFNEGKYRLSYAKLMLFSLGGSVS